MKNVKKGFWMTLLCSTAVLLSACGKKESVEEEGNFTYVPEWLTAVSAEDGGFENLSVVGNRVYYSGSTYNEEAYTQNFSYLDLSEKDAKPVVLKEIVSRHDNEGEFRVYIRASFPTQDGSFYMLTSSTPIVADDATPEAWQAAERQTVYELTKYTESGEELFKKDVTESVNSRENTWISQGFADKDGNVYLTSQQYMLVYDKDGNFETTVEPAKDAAMGMGYINGWGVLADGRLALIQDGSSGVELKIYDAAKKEFSDSYTGLPMDCYNAKPASGGEGNVLLTGQSGIYLYNLEKKESTELLKWLDCNLNGDYAETATMLADGRILVYYRDWNTNENSLILLNKTEASAVPQKEVITLGCFGLDQSLQQAVVNFNKTNEKYKIEIVDYSEDMMYASGEDGIQLYKDARNRFNSDILTGNGTDLFVPDGMDLSQLTQKGVIEDLTPYLEKSTVLKREDFIEPVLKAYTFNGTLTAIPTSFNMTTIFGRQSELGDRENWTMEDMLAFGAAHPDEELFPTSTRAYVLEQCLQFAFDSYVNWETGEVFFDSEEFKQVLKLAKTYPEELDWENQPSEAMQLNSHKGLLHIADIYSPTSWQVVEKMFGEPVKAIGFPSSGESGVKVEAYSLVCMNAASKNKEVCWSFLESRLAEDYNGMFSWGFPIKKADFEKNFAEEMVQQYQTDANGEPLLDEKGEPIKISKGSYGWQDFEIELFAATEEEKENIWNLINRIDGVRNRNDALMDIVSEEAAPFFNGQKSLEEVVDIIQSRAKIYVNESR